MRWFVEVTRVGKGDVLDELCLEASHWQTALKRARELRGEGNTLEGLSVEFLDDGCRALDGMNQVRYVVSKASSDAPIVETVSAAKKPTPASRTAVSAPSSRVAAAPATRAVRPPESREQPPAMSAARSALRPSVSSSAASRVTGASTAREPAKPALDYEDAPGTPPSGTPMNQPRPSLTGRAVEGPTAASPRAESRQYELLSSRTLPSTSRMPLAHHERSFGLRANLSASQLRAFALDRLADVRGEIVGTRSGNVVDIAVFAQPFEGRPTEPPIATLRWCDWLEEPEYVTNPYPEHGGSADEPAERDDEAGGYEDSPHEEEADRRPSPVPAPRAAARPMTMKLGVADRPSAVAQPAEAPAPRAAAPAAAPAPTRPAIARPKVLPKAAPLKTATLDAALSTPAKPAPSSEVAPASKAAANSAAKEAENLIEDPQSEDGFLTSKRPLGSRRSLLGARVAQKAADTKAGDERLGTGTKPEIKAPTPQPGPVAGSKPVGATRIAGGADVKPSALGASGAGTVPRPGTTASSSPAMARPSTRTIVTADDSSGKSVSASAGGFESSASRPRLSRPGTPSEGRVMSREEKDAKHEAARVKASTVPPPAAREGKRVASEELLADLFESLSDLHFQSDSLEAAGFVLAVALEKIPSHIGMVSLYDLDRREYVVVRQEGGTRSALLLRGPESSPFAEAAMKAKKAVLANEADELAEKLDARWQEVGVDVDAYLCAPAFLGGRTLGLVELANPRDTNEYAPADANALTYIGKQFAEFLDSHGVLLDPDAILAAADVRARV